MADLKVEYRYNPNTGIVHRVAVGEDGKIALSNESCNLDDAEDEEIDEEKMTAYVEVRPDKRCQHCFKEYSA